MGLTIRCSFVMDVTKKSSISDAVHRISAEDGKLHILVNKYIFGIYARIMCSYISNSAGHSGPSDMFTNSAMEQKDAQVYGDSLFQTQSFEEWQQLYSLNVSSAFFVITAFLGLLEVSTKDAPGSTASVINITSGVAHMKLTFGVVSKATRYLPSFFVCRAYDLTSNKHCYNATKGALSHLTKVMASDFALKGLHVRVNAIAPGRFISEMTGTQEEEDEDMKKPGLALNPNPLKRTGRYGPRPRIITYMKTKP